MRESLIPFFDPQGVAIIGASQNPEKLSNGIVRNMQAYGFKGEIYPVNPGAMEVNGLRCYPSISDIPGRVDLAVIILPAQHIASVLHDCGRKGVRTVTVISGGFKEVGADGQALERELLEILAEYKMRMIGPNCVGTMNLVTGMNSTFIRGIPARGGIGFISQSGAVCGGVVDHIAEKGVGFSHFLSLGNMADVSETDMIEFLAQDQDTSVIAVYMEGVKDGRRFIDVCRQVTQRKPIVVLKAGRSDEGAKAVSSHTGSLAGSHAAYQASFAQSGVIEVFSVADLLNVSMALDSLQDPTGNRTVIVTNSGGPAALASDSFAQYGIRLADLSPQTQLKLAEKLNPAAQVANPVDMLGGADYQEYGHALRTVLEDDGVDMALAVLVPTSLVVPVQIARAVIDAASHTHKPVIACLMGFESVQEASLLLHQHHIPCVDYPVKTGVMLQALLKKANRNMSESPKKLNIAQGAKDAADAVFQQQYPLKLWGEHVTRDILAAYQIPLVDGDLAANKEQAQLIADKIGFPVVLKGASRDILHKSDASAVVINIQDKNALDVAFEHVKENMLKANPQAMIDGMLIEKMAQPGKEVIIGMKRDPTFGSLIMFGMGGVFVELFKDVAFRVAPLTQEDIGAMIRSTHAYQLLKGWRGEPEYDIAAIEDVIAKLSQFAVDFPQVAEVEINPLRVFPKGSGALALDCRMVVE
jgi:acetate---CoA ligase (ADP-forming)